MGYFKVQIHPQDRFLVTSATSKLWAGGAKVFKASLIMEVFGQIATESQDG